MHAPAQAPPLTPLSIPLCRPLQSGAAASRPGISLSHHVRCRFRVAEEAHGGRVARLAGAWVLACAPLLAQQVEVRAHIGGAVVVRGAPAPGQAEDQGVPVEMFENANLDRYLRRAEAFLERGDHSAAIQVLQDVAEGRTPVEVGAADAPEVRVGDPGAAAAPNPGAPVPANTAPGPTSRTDERHAVFASDGRLYRPVRRLGQEMLARMPEIGIELYRSIYEGDAERMLAAAVDDGSVHALQAVAERYFVSLAAGRALALTADRCMHEGRYRTAVQVLRDLLEVYPAANRRRIGFDDNWFHFKIALCLSLSGEPAAGRQIATELAERHPGDSLRILGELQSVQDLPEESVFRAASPARRVDPAGTVSWIADADADLVPLWQYRFRTPDPYREPKSARGEGGVFVDDVVTTMAMPFAGRYFPGTAVRFADALGEAPFGGEALPRVLFFEHFRLREASALTGIMLREGDGTDEVPAARDGHPKVRIAAADYALLRPSVDEHFVYGVLGYGRKSTPSTQVFRSSDLVAYERGSLERRWSSNQWFDGSASLRDVTFLAAPTVFGERLLLPALRRDVYTLECIDRRTGRPEWSTPLHAGGSAFFKAPGTPVAVEGGLAFVATNAGCLAAVDAFTGDLRWIRRYERSDPRRQPAAANRARDRREVFAGRSFVQVALSGFYPSELIVESGLVCIAPVDGDMLMCLDGASGQPVWMLDAASRYVPFGRLRTIVGHVGGDLFLISDNHLVCIALRGGLVRWARELPPIEDKTAGRGRGAIFDGHVVIPGQRELLVFDRASADMRRVPLPGFGAGREPLVGSCHLHSQGPWLAVGYGGGVEFFSSRGAMRRLAAVTLDPLLRATCLLHGGEPLAAEQGLREFLRGPVNDPLQKHKAQRHLLALLRDRALRVAPTAVADGLAVLDELVPWLADRELRLAWHLARLDCCKEGGDMRRHEEEQQKLYDFMEGRR